MQDDGLREPRLDAGGDGRVGVADCQAEHRERARRQAQLSSHLDRVVAHGADIAGAEAKRF